jgi:hypothetical protein
MEKIITISGKDVGFKAPASLPVRYFNATGRDLFVDLQTLADGTDQVESKAKLGKKKSGEVEFRFNKNWNTMVFYGIAHTMARAFDDEVSPNIEDWIDTFESFPIFEVFAELKPLLNASLQTSKK